MRRKRKQGARRLCPEAQEALLRTLQLSCCMLFLSFVILIHIGGLSAEHYRLYQMARELWSSPPGLLLLGTLACFILQDQSPG